MKAITVNPFVKFFFLLVQIIIILIVDNKLLTLFIVVVTTIYLIIKKSNVKIVLSGLKFGLLLAFFMLVFSQIRYGNIVVSVHKSLDLLEMYLSMILVSIVYKMETGNKELAYVLSIVLSPLKIIGFDQNKLYTLFLIILSQIYTMKDSAMRMYEHTMLQKNNEATLKRIIKLINPFIHINLKHNELLAIGLINNGYNVNKKNVKPYLIIKHKLGHYLILIVMLLCEILIIGAK